MKRWHKDKNLMSKRWKEEIDNHTDPTFNTVEQGCTCLRGKGTMRKRRPHDRCAPSAHCACCEMEREEHRLEKKRIRREGKKICKNANNLI